MNLFNRWVCYILSWSMIYTPLAEAAQKKAAMQGNVAAVKEMLQESDWGNDKVKTYGDLWKQIRSNANKQEREAGDRMISQIAGQALPQMQVSTIKNANGKENVRMLFTDKFGQTTNVEFLLESPNKVVKINGQVFSYDDLLSADQSGKFDKLVANDRGFAKAARNAQMRSTIAPSNALFKKMTKYQRAVWFLELRKLNDAAVAAQEELERNQKTSVNDMNSKIEFVRRLISGQFAEAFTGPCIVAGYVGEYQTVGGRSVCSFSSVNYQNRQTNLPGYQGRIGAQYSDPQSFRSNCGANQFACNPLIYGFQTSGSPYCVANNRSNAESQTATAVCNDRSPLHTPEQSAAFVRSLIKSSAGDSAVGQFFADGNTSTVRSQEALDQLRTTYIAPFDTYITDLINRCNAGAPTGERNQSSACRALEDRKAALHTWIDNLHIQTNTPPPTPPAPTPTPVQASADPTPPAPVPQPDPVCTGGQELVLPPGGGSAVCACPNGSEVNESDRECHYICPTSGDDLGRVSDRDRDRNGRGGYSSRDRDRDRDRERAEARAERDRRDRERAEARRRQADEERRRQNAMRERNSRRHVANENGIGCPEPLNTDQQCPRGQHWDNRAQECKRNSNVLGIIAMVALGALAIWGISSLFRHRHNTTPPYVPPACNPDVSQCGSGGNPDPGPNPPGPITPTVEGGSGTNGNIQTGGTGQ